MISNDLQGGGGRLRGFKELDCTEYMNSVGVREQMCVIVDLIRYVLDLLRNEKPPFHTLITFVRALLGKTLSDYTHFYCGCV